MSTKNENNESQPAKISVRKAFERAACVVGIIASVGTGLADPGSSLQVASAILMGTSWGTAYLLKR